MHTQVLSKYQPQEIQGNPYLYTVQKNERAMGLKIGTRTKQKTHILLLHLMEWQLEFHIISQ